MVNEVFELMITFPFSITWHSVSSCCALHTASMQMGSCFDGPGEADMMVAHTGMVDCYSVGTRERASGTVLYFPFLYSTLKVYS